MENESKEKLVRLIYVSIMTVACDTEALENILKVSRINNKKRNITGFLCYDPAFFMQCIEGPREAINGLYTDISRDKRHTNLTLLEYVDVDKRLFGDWEMGFIPTNNIDKVVLEKYATSGGRFNPFTLNGEKAREFLLDVVKLHQNRVSY